MQVQTEDQKRFIVYELGLLTINATLSTRGKNNPVYESSVKSHQKSKPKKAIRNVLSDLEQKYIKSPSSEEHTKYIADTAARLTKDIGKYLHNNRFRIGIAQKLINLHLKYLWCSGVIQEPPHCPIDGIIRDAANLEYNWIISDDIEDYKAAIESLNQISQTRNETLAQWELRKFRRRDDQ